jgi:DNA-binding transcriptional MerR regulator
MLFDGELLTLSEIAERLGISYRAVLARVERGIPLEEKPINRENQYEYKGKLYKISELVKITGLQKDTIIYRVKHNISLDKELNSENKYEFDGLMLTAKEISKRTGLSPELIRYRVRKGIPLDQPKRKW